MNLLEGEYDFITDRAQNDTRFTIHAILAPQTPTDTEMTASDNRTDRKGSPWEFEKGKDAKKVSKRR